MRELWNQAKVESHFLKLSKLPVGKYLSKSLILRLRNSPKKPSITDRTPPRITFQLILPSIRQN